VHEHLLNEIYSLSFKSASRIFLSLHDQVGYYAEMKAAAGRLFIELFMSSSFIGLILNSSAANPPEANQYLFLFVVGCFKSNRALGAIVVLKWTLFVFDSLVLSSQPQEIAPDVSLDTMA